MSETMLLSFILGQSLLNLYFIWRVTVLDRRSHEIVDVVHELAVNVAYERDEDA